MLKTLKYVSMNREINKILNCLVFFLGINSSCNNLHSQLTHYYEYVEIYTKSNEKIHGYINVGCSLFPSEISFNGIWFGNKNIFYFLNRDMFESFTVLDNDSCYVDSEYDAFLYSKNDIFFMIAPFFNSDYGLIDVDSAKKSVNVHKVSRYNLEKTIPIIYHNNDKIVESYINIENIKLLRILIISEEQKQKFISSFVWFREFNKEIIQVGW